jgi:hypothetical protein
MHALILRHHYQLAAVDCSSWLPLLEELLLIAWRTIPAAGWLAS